MASTARIGEISSKLPDQETVEWTIPNFFSYQAEDRCYSSPSFGVSGSRWYLEIYPNGETRYNSVGWIGLYLCIEKESSLPQAANFAFALKRADGIVEQMKKDFVWVFDVKSYGFGSPSIWQRSDSMKRRSELAPSDALTVTCTLRMANKGADCSARMHLLSEDFLDMFTSRRSCDATLKVKQQEFPVHKFVLAARSPVFAAMFEADMKEKQTGIVDIIDCDPEPFRKFLEYLYCGKAENLSSNAFELYRIAAKYDVKGLKPACVVSIMLNLTVENVFEATALGHQFSETGLKLKTQAFFNENFGEIVSTVQWGTFLNENSVLANELLKKFGSEMKFISKE